MVLLRSLVMLPKSEHLQIDPITEGRSGMPTGRYAACSGSRRSIYPLSILGSSVELGKCDMTMGRSAQLGLNADGALASVICAFSVCNG